MSTGRSGVDRGRFGRMFGAPVLRPHRSLLFVCLTLACAGRDAAPPPAAPPPAPPVDDSAMQPPPFAAEAPAPRPLDARAAREAQRREIFVAAWTTVRDKHYDQTLGGVDWSALRARYEPLAVGAPDERTFYRLLNEMLGRLGQSHLEASGPGAEPLLPEVDKAASPDGGAPVVSGVGEVGLVVRMIEGQPTVTQVRPGSSADQRGLRPGFVVTHVAGRALVPLPAPPRPLRPVEERFQLRRLAAHLLSGPVGTRVTVRYRDGEDRPGEALLERRAPQGPAVQLSHLAPIHPEVRVHQLGDVGVIAFNFFLLQPVLADVQAAIEGFRARGAKAIIFDLRGNPGGTGAMAIPVAARLVSKPMVLGTMHLRGFANAFTVTPPLGVKPFTGRVVILTDEGTASTSEILAAGLQEAGRAVVVGDTTLGAVLPSMLEQLPHGAVLQYVVADFRTPKGVLLEGRGVQPDQRVLETRAALRSGRDPVLDAGLVAARASTGKP